MNTRRIRIKADIISPVECGYVAKSNSASLLIPHSVILKTNKQAFFDKNKSNQWTNFYLDPDFFKNNAVLVSVGKLKKAGKLFVYGKRSHGINWDYVLNIKYSKPGSFCFFCDEPLKAKVTKTRDHLIPTVVLKAYGYEYIDDNIVDCCFDCNKEKASLPPEYFRIKAKRLAIHSEKWRAVYKVLNKILINKNDPHD